MSNGQANDFILLLSSFIGFGSWKSTKMTPSKGYHTDITGQTQEIAKKNGLQLLISTVGLITEAKPARDIVQEAPDNKQPLVDIILEDIPNGGIFLGHLKGFGALKRRAQIAG
jgi:hypothetical protein